MARQHPWRDFFAGILIAVVGAIAGAGTKPFWWQSAGLGVYGLTHRTPFSRYVGTWIGEFNRFGAGKVTYVISGSEEAVTMTAKWYGIAIPPAQYPSQEETRSISFNHGVISFNDYGSFGSLKWDGINKLAGTLQVPGEDPLRFQLTKSPPDQRE